MLTNRYSISSHKGFWRILKHAKSVNGVSAWVGVKGFPKFGLLDDARAWAREKGLDIVKES